MSRHTPVPSEPKVFHSDTRMSAAPVSQPSTDAQIGAALGHAEERAVGALNSRQAENIESLRRGLVALRRSVDKVIDKLEREGSSAHVTWALADEIATQATEIVRAVATVAGVAAARTAVREAWRARHR